MYGIQINFDHEQRRIAGDRLQVFACGTDFNTIYFSNVFMEPITNTIMLSPMWDRDTWDTTNTGITAKTPLASFTTNDATKWEERQDHGIKGPWCCVKDTSSVNNTLLSNSTSGKNRGFYFATYIAAGGNNTLLFSIGKNSTVSSVSGWSFDFYSGNHVKAYKDGKLIKEGNLHGSGVTIAKNVTATTQIAEVFILPFRKKDILIYSRSHGGGFIVTDESISDDETSPVIFPDTNLWVRTHHGMTQLMLADASFDTSGYVISNPISFYDRPEASDILTTYHNPSWIGDRPYKVYADSSYVATHDMVITLLDENNNPFVANAVNQICKLKCTLTSSNASYSPFFYGSLLSYTYRYDFTDSSEQSDVTDYVVSASLSVGERPGDCHFDFELSSPDYIENFKDVPTPLLSVIENRPTLVMLGETTLIDGVNELEDNIYSWNDPAQRLHVTVKTLWSMLEEYEFVERTPFDDFLFTDALKFVAELSGIPLDNIRISESDVRMDFHPSKDASEFSFVASVGEKADKVFIRLMELYASTWYYGVKPSPDGPILFALSPEDLGSTPLVTLYSNIDDAMNIGGYDFNDAKKYLYRSYKHSYLKFEGNDVRVTGYDTRTDKLIQAYIVDYDSQKVTTLPSLRPQNWVGQMRRVGLSNPAFWNQSLVNQADCILASRVMTKYRISSIECHLLLDEDNIPYWRGDCIKLYNHNVIGRIQTLGSDFEFDSETDDGSDNMRFYKAHYVIRDPVII